MGKEKEGLLTSVPEALTEAAKINMAAAKEMASSAVATFVDTVTGREKPRRGKRRATKKKASTTSKRRNAGSSAATTKRRAGRKTTAKKPVLTGSQAQRNTATKARGISTTKSRKGSKSRSR